MVKIRFVSEISNARQVGETIGKWLDEAGAPNITHAWKSNRVGEFRNFHFEGKHDEPLGRFEALASVKNGAVCDSIVKQSTKGNPTITNIPFHDEQVLRMWIEDMRRVLNGEERKGFGVSKIHAPFGPVQTHEVVLSKNEPLVLQEIIALFALHKLHFAFGASETQSLKLSDKDRANSIEIYKKIDEIMRKHKPALIELYKKRLDALGGSVDGIPR